jgi:putative transcriptional regulator
VPAAGRLLVATPIIDEPTFARTVVLLLDHDEDGSLGVVLNRPTEVDVDDVLPDWEPVVTGDAVVFDGGPVGRDSALGLAAVPGREEDEPLGFRRVTGAFGLVDLDAPPELLAAEVSGLRIFAGYAGWSAGQLDDELDDGAWFVVEAEHGDAFTTEPTGLWRSVLRRQRGEMAFVSTYPHDPADN